MGYLLETKINTQQAGLPIYYSKYATLKILNQLFNKTYVNETTPSCSTHSQ